MKRICEFCGKEYEVDISLGNWNKDNVQIIVHGKGSGNLVVKSSRFCCFKCGKEYNNKKKINSYLNHYGVNNPNKLKEIRDKIKNTSIKRYGINNYHNRLKAKATCLEKYGEEIYSKTKDFKDKSRQTCLKKYGVINVFQSDKIKIKSYNTKKKNHTINTSKPEEQIYKLLLQKYSQVERQYRSEKYPFNCDFYIPNLDLYIEYQGYWTHGKEPYNKNNKKHQKQIKLWKEKTKEINWKNHKKGLYLGAIHIWTISDPLKRQIAKENGLNWIEFFNMEEFMKWYNLT